MGRGMRRWDHRFGSTVLLLLVACTKDAPTDGHRLRASLQVHAILASAGEQVDVAVSYARTGLADVSLARVQAAVSGPGRLDVPIELDLTGCLGDAARLGGAAAGCPVMASVVLRDAGGVALDSARIGPLEVREGATVASPTPVVLQAAATLVVESGDQQLGWNGQPLQLPVVVRLTDRAGGAIAGRMLTVTPTSGSGNVVAGSVLVTDATGRATIGYRLGTPLGAQGFRVAVQVGSPTVTATVALTAVEPRRERVSGGAWNSCAILSIGTRCWGNNDFGGLGTRAITVPGDTVFPVAIANNPGFIALTANKANNIYGGNVCGLTSTGAVYCWGLTPNSGLGPSATDTCLPFGQSVPCFREPVPIPSPVPFTVIDLGGMGTQFGGTSSFLYPERLCGVSPSGDAYCWGDNADGGIGDGTLTSRGAPTLVSGGLKWIDVTSGMYASCGLTVFGEAYCWGRNSLSGFTLGGLGTGDTLSSLVPRRVATTERFRAIDAGSISTCALTLNGELRCWGVDQGGGTGSSGGFGNSLSPVAPPGPPVSLARLSLGAAHGCGVTTTGAGFCWGRNRQGNLGDGSPISGSATFSYSFVRVRSSGNFSEIGAAILHTCGLGVAGDAFCWGVASRGALGNGSRTLSVGVPSRVAFSPPTAGVPTQILPFQAMPTWAVRGGSCFGIFSVQVLDANGYPVSGESVQFAALTPGASVSAPTALTSATGVASVNCTTSTTVGPNTFIARATRIPGDSVLVSTNGQVPGPPASIFCRFCASGISGVVGVSSPIAVLAQAVQVSDTLGLPVAGVTVTFTKLSTSATTFVPALPASFTTNLNGEAALTSFVPDTIVRVDSVRAVVAGLANQPQLIVLSSVPAAPNAARFLAPPATTRAGQAVAPALSVTLHDRYGNLATNASARAVVLTITGSGGGVLGGTTTVNTVNGTATFSNLTVSAAGTYQLVATVAGLPTITSALFTIVP